MPNPIRHFAVHADQVERARAFYEAVFGWQFAIDSNQAYRE